MATINFQYRGTKDVGKLSVRFIHGAYMDYRVSTPILSKKEYWFKRTTKNGKSVVRHRTLNELNFNADVKNHQHQLELFAEQLLNKFDRDFHNRIPIDRDWLKEAIDTVFPILDTKNKISKAVQEQKDKKMKVLEHKEHIYKSNLITSAIKKMFVKYATNINELKKFKVSYNLLVTYQKHQNKIFRTKDLNQDFADNFMNWAFNDMKYRKSYINGQLKKFRRAVVYAYENDEEDIIEVSKKLKSFKMFKDPYKDKVVITLNYDELDQIDDTVMTDNSLIDAKKTILIGCETGLRYSDFNKLVDSNLKVIKGIDCWEFKTQKTGKLVRIPKSDRVIYLLNKYGFPETNYPENGVKLNEDIKAVCKDSQINEKVEGSRISSVMVGGTKTKRNITGTHPKHKLICTRTLRRSFATNYFGKIDTAFITDITGHSTEKMLREYINVKDTSNVVGTVEQINAFHKKRTVIKKLHLEVVKKKAK